MPGPDTLAEMYGSTYGSVSSDGYDILDPKDPRRVLDWVTHLPAGTFVDYGCGAGRLLSDVRSSGWNAVGVEFDPQVASEIERRVNVPVANRFTVDAMVEPETVDVLHLGDVIEHLTEPASELSRMLRMLKHGGYLIAQGPLEAHPTLFTHVLKLFRRLRSSSPAEMAPYHVMLATGRGQQTFFERLGLRTVDFSLHEVAWPAPATLKRSDLLRPRALVLFTLRRLSQLVSAAMRSRQWGNRYFYVGQRA
jgi:SAM-dependent methyltransferase